MQVNGVDCEQVQASLSARLDGEDPGLDPAAEESHLRRCPSCREFQRSLPAVMTTVRADDLGAGHSGDVASRITKLAGPIDRSGVWWVLRALLFATALGYLLLEIPELMLSNDPHHGHLAHHLGIFEAAYAITLIVVAFRPAKARAMVPFTAVLAVGMVLFAVIDVVRGEAFPLSELSHTLELAGLVLVWLLATRRGWPGRAQGGHAPVQGGSPTNDPPPRSERPDLTVVDQLDRRRQPPSQRAG
jgi:hypothetical protein